MNENALTTTVQTQKAIQAAEEARLSIMCNKLRHMITNGRKLSDGEIMALAQFSVQENLDPFNHECWYIPNVGPTIGIQGLRRKAQEKLGPGHYFKIDFIDVTEEFQQDDASIGYAFRAILKDTETSTQFLATKSRFIKEGLEEADILDVLGSAPAWDAVGFWNSKEKNDLKDKFFLPEERAKKRAEALAIKKRFNLSYDYVAEDKNGRIDVIDVVERSSERLEPGEDEIGNAEFTNAPESEPQPVGNEVKPTEPKQTESKRPYVPEMVFKKIEAGAKKHDNDVASEAQTNLMVGMLEACFADKEATQKRHLVSIYLTGCASTKDNPATGEKGITDNYKLAILDWLKPVKDAGGAYMPDSMAQQEAWLIWREAAAANGQTEIDLNLDDQPEEAY